MGCCLVALLAVFAPRITLFVLWAFTSYTSTAFKGWLWPLLGFIFMPVTTLTYIAAMHWNNHEVTGWWVLWMILAVMWDCGANFGSASSSETK